MSFVLEVGSRLHRDGENFIKKRRLFGPEKRVVDSSPVEGVAWLPIGPRVEQQKKSRGLQSADSVKAPALAPLVAGGVDRFFKSCLDPLDNR